MTGFNSKRDAVADKLQEPINLLEARKIAAEYGTPDSQVDNGNLYFALSKCLEHIDAQPAQEPVAQGSKEHLKIMMEHSAWDDRLELSDALANIDEFYATAPPLPAQEPEMLTIVYQSGYHDGKKAALAGREWNFCERCGKRTKDLTVIHTCTPPQGDA